MKLTGIKTNGMLVVKIVVDQFPEFENRIA